VLSGGTYEVERECGPARSTYGGRGTLLRRRRLRLRLFVFVFAAAEDLLEEVFLLGWSGLLRGVGCVAARWGVGCLADDGSTGCGWRDGSRMAGIRRGGLVATDAEEFLDEVLLALAHLATGVDRRRAVEEGDVEAVVRAGGVDQKTGGPVDVSCGDALGSAEGFDVRVLGKLDSALHELGPDGSGGVGAFNLDVGVVVVADPDNAEEVGGVAGKPGVVAGSCFAGCRSSEAVPAYRTRSRAVVQGAFEQRLGKVRNAGVENLLAFGREVGDDVAVRVTHGGEHPWGEVNAVVGEDGVGAGHIDRRGAVGANGNGRGGPGGGDAGGAGEGGDVFVADLLREGYGRDVERVSNSGGRGDHAGELVLCEVAGGIGLAVGAEVLGVIVELSESSEDSAIAERHTVEARVVSRGVDERLEDGTGGAVGDGVVDLGDAIVTPADQRENLSGVRVDGDQGNLRIGDRFGLFALGCFLLLADDFINVAHSDLNGVGSNLLEVGVERGVDAEVLMREVLIADALDELVVDEVDEVGGFAGVDVGRRKAERFSLGFLGLRGGDGFGFHHGVEDDVAALHGAFGVAIGVAVAGVLQKTGESCALCEIELAQVLAEKHLGRLAKSVDLITAAVTEVHLVGIHREDLLLVEPGLELQRDEGLDHLPLVALLGREKQIFRELLGKRRAAAV